MQASYSNATLLSYNRFWKNISDFLKRNCLEYELPVNTRCIALYLSYLHHTGKSVSSLRTALAGIAFKHKIGGYVDPTKEFILLRIIAGTAKTRRSPPKKRPITVDILRNLVDGLHKLKLTHTEVVLYKAVFFIMYYACLRISEVASSNHLKHTLMFNDVFLTGRSISEKNCPRTYLV